MGAVTGLIGGDSGVDLTQMLGMMGGVGGLGGVGGVGGLEPSSKPTLEVIEEEDE